MKQPRKQAPKNNLSFKDYLDKYPATATQSAISQLNDSIGWGMLQAYAKLLQRQYEVASLDLVKHSNQVQAAAHASGYAQACEDFAERFMQQMVDHAVGKDGLVEGAERVEE